MNFSIFIILNVSACCSRRSKTRYFPPAICLISSFTASMSDPGLSLNSSCESMPCCPKRLRAKAIDVST